MRSLLRVFAALTAAIGLTLAIATPAAARATKLRGTIEGIPAFDIDSYSFGVSVTPPGGGGGGGGAGKAIFKEFVIRKTTDAASALIFQSVATGKHHRDGSVTATTTGRNPHTYLTYEFKDIVISSYQTDGSSAEEPAAEQLTLTYTEIKVTHTPRTGPASSFCFNVVTNVAC